MTETIDQQPTPAEEPPLKRLWANMGAKNKDFTVPYGEFEKDMQDENNVRSLHANLPKFFDGFKVPYDEFTTDMGLSKKKSQAPLVSGNDSAPIAKDGLAESSSQPLDQPLAGAQLTDSAGQIDTASANPGLRLAPGDEYIGTGAAIPSGEQLRQQTEDAAMGQLADLPGTTNPDVRPVVNKNAQGGMPAPLEYGMERVVVPKEHNAQVPANTVTDPETGLRYFDRPLNDKVDGKKQTVYEGAKALFENSLIEMGQGLAEGSAALGNSLAFANPYGSGYDNSGDTASAFLESGKRKVSDRNTRAGLSLTHPESIVLKSAQYAPVIFAQVAQTLAPELRAPEAVTAALGMVTATAFDAQIVHGASEAAKRAKLTGVDAARYTVLESALVLAGFKTGSKLMAALGDKLAMKIAPQAAREAIALDATRTISALEAKLGRAATNAETSEILHGSLRKSMPGIMQIPKEMFQQAPFFGGVEAIKLGVNQVAAPALGGEAEDVSPMQALDRIGGGFQAGLEMGAVTGGLGAVLGTGKLAAPETPVEPVAEPATEPVAGPQPLPAEAGAAYADQSWQTVELGEHEGKPLLADVTPDGKYFELHDGSGDGQVYDNPELNKLAMEQLPAKLAELQAATASAPVAPEAQPEVAEPGTNPAPEAPAIPEQVQSGANASPVDNHYSGTFNAFAQGLASATEKEFLGQLEATGRVNPRVRNANESDAQWQQAVAGRQSTAQQMEQLTGKKFAVMTGKDANGVDAVFVAKAAPEQVQPLDIMGLNGLTERLAPAAATPEPASVQQAEPFTGDVQPAESGQPPVEPPTAAVDAVEEPAGTKDRKSMVNVLADPETGEAAKQLIRDAGIDKYTPRSPAEAEAQVDEYLRDSPLADAVKKALGTADTMNGDVRTILRAKVLQTLGKALDAAVASGDTATAEAHYNDTKNVALAMAERLTDAGQEINAAKFLSRYAPETAVYAAEKEVAKQAEAKKKEAAPKIKKEAAAVRQAKSAAVDAALASAKVGEAAATAAARATNGKKPKGPPKPNSTPPDAPAWGSTNKLFTKAKIAEAKAALKKLGLSSFVPPELLHLVGYHMEAGARSFAEMSKRVVRDLGAKVKPLLADAYEKAKAEMIAKGDSGQGFDGKDGVAAALNKELADNLADRVVSAAKPKVAGVFDPVREMLDTLTKKVSETLPKAAPTPKAARDAIAHSLNNRAEYADVFEQSKALVEEKIDALKISDAAKQQMRDDLADYHAEIIGKPFADQQFARAFREAETAVYSFFDAGKNRGEQLDQAAKASDADIARNRQAVIDEVVAGVTDPQAKRELADYTGAEFDARLAERQLALRNKAGIYDPGQTPPPKKAPITRPTLSARVADLLSRRATPEQVAPRLLGEVIPSGVKELKTTLDQIARDHLNDPTDVGKTLAQKFIQEAGITAAAAQHYADAIEQEFAAAIAKNRDKQLNQKYSQLVKTKGEKVAKAWLAKMQELFTLSPTSDSRVQGLLSETLDLPTLSLADVANLRALAQKVKDAKGKNAEAEAVFNLMLAQKNIKGLATAEGVKAFFYAHLLTGLFTHAKNFVFTGFNGATQLVSETGYAGYLAMGHAIRTRSLPSWKIATAPYRGIGKSFKSSLDQAYKVIATGVEPLDIDDKYGTPNDLEALRRKFPTSSNADVRALQLGLQKYAAAMSYAGRFLKANDVLFQVNFANMRAFNLAIADAMSAGKTLPSDQIWANAMDKLYNTNLRLADAQAQAFAEIPNAGVSKNPLALDNTRFRMRVQELMEESRDAAIDKESRAGAARDAFNGPLEGMLGDATAKLQTMTDVEGPGGVQLLKTQIPFTKIISNQVNASLDYIPLVGGYRALRGKTGHQGNAFERKYTGKERAEVAIRATMGAALMFATGTALLGPKRLSGSGPDDQEKKRALKAAGWMESSYNFGSEANPNWWSYKNTKFNLLLSAIANVREGEEYNGADYTNDPLAIKRLGAITFGVLQGVKSNTGFQNVADMFTAIGNVGDGTADERFMRWIQRQAGSSVSTLLTPFGNMTNQVSKIAQRSLDVPKQDAQTAGEVMTQNLNWNAAPPAYDDLGYPMRIDNDVFHSTQPDWHDETERAIRTFQAKYGKRGAVFVPDAQRMNNDMAVLRQNPTAPVLTAGDNERMQTMTDTERKAFLQKRGDLEGPMGKKMFADFKLQRATAIRAGYALLLRPLPPVGDAKPTESLEDAMTRDPRQAERLLKNLYRNATRQAKLAVLNGDNNRMNFTDQQNATEAEASGSDD